MRSLRVPIGVATLLGLMVVPALAGQHGNSGNHGPSTHAAPAHPNAPANAGPKSNNGPTSPKHTGNGSPKKSSGTTSATSTNATPAPTSTAVNFNTTPVGAKLAKNAALQSKLSAKLTTLSYNGNVFEAAYGFKNLGQFVAATNVSQNLGIPFQQLKLQMTGVSVDSTGKILRANVNPDGTVALVDPANATNPATTKSLGQSIQALKPTANATAAANAATVEAENEIEHTSNPTTKAGKKKS
jgi:hypothetical protein